MVARDVENNLRNRNSAPCLQWCHANKSKLKKLQSTLELNVRIQEFVELVKSDQRMAAVSSGFPDFYGEQGEEKEITLPV